MVHRVMANSAMLAFMLKQQFGGDALQTVNRTAAELAAVTFGPLPIRPHDYEVDEGTTSQIQALHDLLSQVQGGLTSSYLLVANRTSTRGIDGQT